MLDEILEKLGLRYEDLDTPGHSGEKETLLKMESDARRGQVSLESTREYISSLREAVERELVDEPEFNYLFIFKVPNRKQVFLKARLKNYLLLESYLSSPERMKQMMENMLAGIAGKKVA